MTEQVGGIEYYIDADASAVLGAGQVIDRTTTQIQSDFQKVEAATKNLIAKQLQLGSTIDKTGKVIDKFGNENVQASHAVQALIAKEQELVSISQKATQTYTSLIKNQASATGGMRSMRGVAQSLGYQMQDVAIQAQMGTNAFVILGQQGSQFASAFGPTGAVVGAILAVSSAIGMALIPSLNSVEKEFGDLPNDIIKRLEKLKVKFQETDAASYASLTRVEVGKLNAEYEEEAKKLAELEEQQKRWGSATATSTAGLAGGMNQTGMEIAKVKARMDALAQAMQHVSDMSVNSMNFEGIEEEFEKINKAQIASLKESIDQRQRLITNFAAFRAEVESGAWSEERAREEERYAAQMERLTAFYEEKKALLISAGESTNALQRLYDDENALNYEAYQRKLRDIDDLARKQKMNAVASAFGDVASLMNTESKKLFKIGKIAAIASATIDGIESAVAAWKFGMKIGGPPVAAGFAAASVLKTGTLISQIKSQQFGGASAGGATSFSGGLPAVNTQDATPLQPSRNISITLAGSSFGAGGVRDLIDQINAELGDGYTLTAN